jgi:hypothetical protein
MAVSRNQIEFDLVAVDGEIVVSETDWTAIRYSLLEFQPASRVSVWSYGDSVEVAPGFSRE